MRSETVKIQGNGNEITDNVKKTMATSKTWITFRVPWLKKKKKLQQADAS